MAKFTEVLAIGLSFCSFLSSVCYTYVYVQGQKATFFDQLYSSYSAPEIMSSFDTLESFLAKTGPETYASEYVRLKSMARETYAQVKQGQVSESSSQQQGVLLGQQLDGSRRRLLHYLGKVLMFYRTGYVTKEMLHEFPGRNRAVHFIRLLEPLITTTAATYNVGLEEHVQILRGIKDVYAISDKEVEMTAFVSGNGNSKVYGGYGGHGSGKHGGDLGGTGAAVHDEA